MNKNDFCEFFYTFAIYPKIYELHFISLGSEVKQTWKNLANTIFFVIRNGDQKYKVLYETGIWILQLDSFMFFIFLHLIFPHIKFLNFTIEYTLQFYIKYSDLNRDFDAESKKWSLVYLFLN